MADQKTKQADDFDTDNFDDLNVGVSNEDLIADNTRQSSTELYEIKGMLNFINKNLIIQNDNITKLLKIILGVLVLLLVVAIFK